MRPYFGLARTKTERPIRYGRQYAGCIVEYCDSVPAQRRCRRFIDGCWEV